MILKTFKEIALIVAVVLALAATWFYYSTREPEIANRDSSGRTIVAFGDSLTAGTGSTPGNDFVSVLSRKLNQPVINRGQGGDTTESGLRRVGTVLADEPRMVIVLLGGNDALRRIPREETFANYRAIIKELQSRGAMTVVVGIQGGLFSDGYNTEFKKIARETQSIFVSDILDGIIGREEYMSDAIHPNDNGYAVIADRIYQVIKKYAP